MAIREVRISKSAKRSLKKVPGYIVDKLETWVDTVERDGLHEVRRIPGYHDEPLKGERQGQRSIRLSRH
jgi:proteic killer suppression protein